MSRDTDLDLFFFTGWHPDPALTRHRIQNPVANPDCDKVSAQMSMARGQECGTCMVLTLDGNSEHVAHV